MHEACGWRVSFPEHLCVPIPSVQAPSLCWSAFLSTDSLPCRGVFLIAFGSTRSVQLLSCISLVTAVSAQSRVEGGLTLRRAFSPSPPYAFDGFPSWLHML